MTDKILIKIDNLEVNLPSTHIIVEKDEYLDLKNKASQGQYMSLSEVLEMVSVSRPWLLEHVLYQADIRSKIDIEKNKDGFYIIENNEIKDEEVSLILDILSENYPNTVTIDELEKKVREKNKLEIKNVYANADSLMYGKLVEAYSRKLTVKK